ncbi:MAG: hypothetical protein FWD40_09775 [Treponema sp.]|nr:hypothetical protein [Treponema sp.]
MKRKIKSFSSVIIVLIAMIGLLFSACDLLDPPDDGNGGAPDGRTFTVSGEFDLPISGTAQFMLTSDPTAVAAAYRAVGADDYALFGVLDDGDITYRLRGTYDPNSGTWQASAKSSMMIFTLGGAVDADNNSLGSSATIAVNTGLLYDPQWETFFVIIDEGDVDVSIDDFDDADPGQEGVPSFALGWWVSNYTSNNVSYKVNSLVSPWRIALTTVKTDNKGYSTTTNEILTIVDIEDKGGGTYRLYFTMHDYWITGDLLAQAFSACIGRNITALSYYQHGVLMGWYTDTAELAEINALNGLWIFYDDSQRGWMSGPGITNDEATRFASLNYWLTWAAENGVSSNTVFSAAEVKFPNTASPSSFDIVDLVETFEYLDPWEYRYFWYDFYTIKNAALEYKYHWIWPGADEEPEFDINDIPEHLRVPGWTLDDYETFFDLFFAEADEDDILNMFPGNWDEERIWNWVFDFLDWAFDLGNGGHSPLPPGLDMPTGWDNDDLWDFTEWVQFMYVMGGASSYDSLEEFLNALFEFNPEDIPPGWTLANIITYINYVFDGGSDPYGPTKGEVAWIRFTRF